MLPLHLKNAPAPDNDATAHSARVTALIAAEFGRNGGWMSFARFMELALHAPGLGYYSAGAAKFGEAGDFVTAPELGALFATALARQAAQILHAGIPDIIEHDVNGLLVPYGDVEALADAIVAVLSDHELAVRLGDGALRSSTQWNRTPTEYARKVRDLVETVLARS